ncbi:MAG: hypothetical protein JF595_07365 [Sphingomonadales bacterium]|nr:hypothetical protein [Sphingomonadales bacterium]
MFVKFISCDRVPTAVNASQVTFISSVTDGTRIRFGEGRSITVIEPMDEVIDRLNRTVQFPDGVLHVAN